MKTSPNSKQSGFTLIELLVVIAIIGVLVGLLLPAVQQAREAARRTACVNKMKQIALAMHNHADVFKALPSGASTRISPTNGVFNSSVNSPWKTFTVDLMPFLERNDIYDQLDLSQDQIASANLQVLAPNVGGDPIHTEWYCPSNPEAFTGLLRNGSYLGGSGADGNRRTGGRCYDISLGPSGFPGNTPDCPGGNAWCCVGNWWAAGNGNVNAITSTPGIANWSYEWGCRFRDILDGTASTFMLIEKRPEFHTWNAMFANNVGVPTSIKPNSPNRDMSGSNNATWGANPYRAKNCGAGSTHTGGLFVAATADAAVHTLNDSIDFRLYNNLGNRGDGNAASIP